MFGLEGVHYINHRPDTEAKFYFLQDNYGASKLAKTKFQYDKQNYATKLMCSEVSISVQHQSLHYIAFGPFSSKIYHLEVSDS